MVPISPAREIIDRLKQATGAASDSDLADRIGVSQQAVSSARRGKVPAAWPRIVLSRFGVSADWLYTGVGAMMFEERLRGPGGCPDESAVERLAAQREQRIRELEAELGEARKAERRALLEANNALKRLVPLLAADQNESPGEE